MAIGDFSSGYFMNKMNHCLMIGSYICGLNSELILHTDKNHRFLLLETNECRKHLHFDFCICSCLLLHRFKNKLAFGQLYLMQSNCAQCVTSWCSSRLGLHFLPLIGRSIEISRDIYVYMLVCLVCQINCAGGIT